MFENIIKEDALKKLSLSELKELNKILKDIPPYDSVENAEKKAEKMYKKYAKTFEPCVKEVQGNEKDGYSILIADKNSDITIWTDAYISSYDNELVTDWNKYIFDLHNWQDVLIKKLQEDDRIFEEVCYCIADYNSSYGLFN